MKTGVARGITTALAAAVLYGAVPVAARFSYDNGLRALEVVSLRTIMIIVVLGCVGLVLRQSFQVPQDARKGFHLQVLATAVVSSCLLASVQFIPVGVAMLVFYTFPILIALASPLFEGTPLSVRKLLLALLAFVGLGVALAPQFGGLDVRGLVLAGFAAIGCALQLLAGRMVAGKMEPVAFTVMVHVAVLPVVIVVLLVTSWGGTSAAPFQVWPAIMAVLATCLLYCAAYFLHMSSVTHAPATVVAPYFNIEPVISTVLAAVLLGETLGWQHVAGGLMVLLAVILTSLPERTREQHG